MPHRLVCPTCSFTLTDRADSHVEHCPVCLQRHRARTILRPEREPGRFARETAVDRAARARAALMASRLDAAG